MTARLRLSIAEPKPAKTVSKKAETSEKSDEKGLKRA